MDEHSTDNGTQSIETTVCRNPGKVSLNGYRVEDETKDDHSCSGCYRIQDHRLEVPLQTFLSLRSDTSYGNAYELHDLTGGNGVKDLEAVEQFKDKAGQLIVSR